MFASRSARLSAARPRRAQRWLLRERAIEHNVGHSLGDVVGGHCMARDEPPRSPVEHADD
jgi:hypothetical protein